MRASTRHYFASIRVWGAKDARKLIVHVAAYGDDNRSVISKKREDVCHRFRIKLLN